MYSRLATMADLDLLYQWVNDPIVRQNSLSTHTITYLEHSKWFCEVLSDKTVQIYIYIHENKPIGQVRVKSVGESAVLSYSVAKEYRGMGFGRKMIEDIELKISSKVHDIIAQVKEENLASRKIFEKLGYSMIQSQGGVQTYQKLVGVQC